MMKRILCILLLLTFLTGGGGVMTAGAEDAPRPPFPISQDADAPPGYSNSCRTDVEYDPDESRPPGELIIVDTLILRPLGFVALGIGAVGALVSLPFAAMTHSGDRVREALIEKPYHYTFTRPLGDLDY